MRGSTIVFAAALLGVGAFVASPARSQSFACTESALGQLSVQGTVQCECRGFPASELHFLPAGYRWDCGILRARMNHEVPATANPYLYPLPEALSVEGALFLDRGGHLRPR